MAQYELVLPKMGESVAEATIIKWVKNPGDSIDTDESVLEIATDKVDSEVPSPVSGKLVKTLFNEGDVVKVGAVIAIIETDASVSVAADSSSASAPAASSASTSVAENAPGIQELSVKAESNASSSITSSGDRFYSPLVKSIASSEGISQAELDAIKGTGSEGRVTKNDILAYVQNRTSAPANTNTAAAAKPATASSSPSASTSTSEIKKNYQTIDHRKSKRICCCRRRYKFGRSSA